MTILITGGAGYIGSHMAHALKDAGEEFVVLDNLSTGFEWLLPAGTELFRGDLADTDVVAKLFKTYAVRSVIHFAASIVVPASIKDPLSYYRNNTVNTCGLIEAAIRAGVQDFIFSSTAAVYGETAPNPIPEDAPTEPGSPYGWSKLMSERILHDAAAASRLRYVTLRYFNACGADPHLRTGQSTRNATHLIKVAVETALGKRAHMEVFGSDYPTPDGTCIRDYIHVSDLVSAHLHALRYLRGGATSIVLNCGYGHGYSVLDVINAVKRVTGTQFAVTYGPRRPGDRAVSISDNGRIKARLGWRPQYVDLDTIIAHAVAWERHLSERLAATSDGQP